MPANTKRIPLAPTGTTGNNTHNLVSVGDAYIAIGFEFVVEAVGATPTVSWKIQGTNVDGTPAATDWFDLAYITDATDTLAISLRTHTAVGRFISFLANPSARRYKNYRLVTSSNTNVTYRADAVAFC